VLNKLEVVWLSVFVTELPNTLDPGGMAELPNRPPAETDVKLPNELVVD